MRNRFARGNQCELRKPVKQSHLLAVEQPVGIEILDLRPDLDRQPVHVAHFKFANAAFSFAHGRQRFRNVFAQCVDGAGTCNDNALHGFDLSVKYKITVTIARPRAFRCRPQ